MDIDHASHTCPGPECAVRVPYQRLACPPHWRQVSEPLRRLVFRTWQYGLGATTQEYLNARALAIADMRPLT